jgi:hypothetical protein
MSHDELNDSALYVAFVTAQLPKQSFHHREHVRVAFLCLARAGDLAAGAAEFRAALRRFAEAHGVPYLFHETLTWAYLIVIHERMTRASFATSADFLDANADLLDHRSGALARYYDVGAVTASQLARSCFLLPGDPRL